MPTKAGRLTTMEQRFVKHMARTNDAKYAATQAGYKHSGVLGPRLAANPLIREATFVEVQKFLRDQGAAIGVYTLAELAVDTAIPAGVRRAAASDLAKLSGIGVTEGQQGKEAHEMTASELREHAAKLERQRDAYLKALADQAKPVIDVEQVETGDDDDVFS